MPHLDEGTIHTWLDGQLPPDEARSVEAHVAECRQCADVVAEARGLIAASSRILTALDSVPREVVPKQPPVRATDDDVSSGTPLVAVPAQPTAPTRAAGRARRRWFSGASLAAAAVIVVGIGTVAVMRSAKNRADLGLDQAAAVAASPGPRADSGPVPVVATTPAAPRVASENSLGDRRSAASVPQIAPAPGNAPAERDVANEAGRAGALAGARERLDAPKRLPEARQLADAPPAAPSVARAKVEQQVGAVDAKKAADELPKDARQQEPSGRVALRGNVAAQPPAAQPERITIVRARSLQADAASAARLDSVGSVRGRVTDANNTGIGGVMVTIAGTTTGAVTNSAGEFTLGGVQGGSHRLVVRQVGYQPVTRDITVMAGQTLTTDVVLMPTTTALNEVVVTGAQQATRRDQAGSAKANAAPPPPNPEVAPGAPITAAQSNAVGCYELGITPLAPSRTGFRQVPRRIALDAEIVPANAGGIWYRARDLARTNAMPNGLWRPSGPTAVEIEWTYGSRTGRVTLSGPAGSIMRGSVEEIDRATATGEAGTVVAIRRPCDG